MPVTIEEFKNFARELKPYQNKGLFLFLYENVTANTYVRQLGF